MVDFAKLEADVEKASARKKVADRLYTAARNRLEKARKAQQAAKEPFTKEDILAVYVYGVTNSRGHKVLSDLMKDGIKDGFWYAGTYSPSINQYLLRVAVNYDWDDSKLVRLAEIIHEWLPAVKPGGLQNYNYGKPVKPTPRDGWKVFDIFDHGLSQHGSYYLCQREDGVWVVFEERSARYSRIADAGVQATGSLLEMLEYVRKHLWYNNGPKDYAYDAYD